LAKKKKKKRGRGFWDELPGGKKRQRIFDPTILRKKKEVFGAVLEKDALLITSKKTKDEMERKYSGKERTN